MACHPGLNKKEELGAAFFALLPDYGLQVATWVPSAPATRPSPPRWTVPQTYELKSTLSSTALVLYFVTAMRQVMDIHLATVTYMCFYCHPLRNRPLISTSKMKVNYVHHKTLFYFLHNLWKVIQLKLKAMLIKIHLQ